MSGAAEPRAPLPPGLAAAVQRLLHGAARIASTRLELAQLELELEAARLLRLCLMAVAGLFLLALAALGAAAWLVLSVPPAWQAACLGGLTLACLCGAGLAALRARRLARRRGPLLSLQGIPPSRQPPR